MYEASCYSSENENKLVEICFVKNYIFQNKGGGLIEGGGGGGIYGIACSSIVIDVIDIIYQFKPYVVCYYLLPCKSDKFDEC